MHIGIHLLYSLPPSNVNRGENGLPKSAWYGGYERQRISSQSYLKAVRESPQLAAVLAADGDFVRTRALVEDLAARVAGRGLATVEAARPVVRSVVEAAGLPADDPDTAGDVLTAQLVTTDARTLATLADPVAEAWRDLADGDAAAIATVAGQVARLLAQPAQHPLVALFGRMLEGPATSPIGRTGLGLDSAIQTSHALGTGWMARQRDYFTAVDTLRPGVQGAAMIGTTGFASATLYQFVGIDLPTWTANLGSAPSATLAAAVLRALATARPGGMRTRYYAETPPDVAIGVVRERGFREPSLVGAFEAPVRVAPDRSIGEESRARLYLEAARTWQMLGAPETGMVGAAILDRRAGGSGLAGDETISEHLSLPDWSEAVARLAALA